MTVGETQTRGVLGCGVGSLRERGRSHGCRPGPVATTSPLRHENGPAWLLTIQGVNRPEPVRLQGNRRLLWSRVVSADSVYGTEGRQFASLRALSQSSARPLCSRRRRIRGGGVLRPLPGGRPSR